MAWPESPPPEQLDVYRAGLSGASDWCYNNSGPAVYQEPVEYIDPDSLDDTETYSLKDGWYSGEELGEWMAANPEWNDQPDPGEPDPEPGGPDPDPEVPASVQRVADFLGQANDPQALALAREAVPVVTAMARSYTRDRGFTGDVPGDDVAAVITTASARLMANPEQLDSTIGGVTIRGGFTGWSLAELFVLNRYRKRAG